MKQNILKSYELWEDKTNWRNYGDKEGSWGTINNQGNPAFALTEKLTNSVDAVLMNKCFESGKHPKSDDRDLPKKPLDAVHKYFENKDFSKGTISIAKKIFLGKYFFNKSNSHVLPKSEVEITALVFEVIFFFTSITSKLNDLMSLSTKIGVAPTIKTLSRTDSHEKLGIIISSPLETFNDNNDKIRESVPEPVVNEYFDSTFFAKILSNLFIKL